MKLKTTPIMNAHLQELGYDFMKTTIPLPERLSAEIDEIRSALVQRYPEGKITDQINASAKQTEVYINDDISIPDFFTYEKRLDIKVIEFLGMGLEVLKRLAIQLQEHFPDDRFSLIMEFSSVQEDVEYPGLEACNASFTQLEYQEPNYFEKTNDWNLDKDYSIGMLEIRI